MPSSISNTGVMTAGPNLQLHDTSIVNSGWADLANLVSELSQLLNSGVLATHGTQLVDAGVDNAGWLNLANAQVSGDGLHNTGVLSADGARISSSASVTNGGWLNLQGTQFDDATASQLQNTGVLSSTGARIAGAAVTNGGWLNLNDSSLGATQIRNTGVLNIASHGSPTPATAAPVVIGALPVQSPLQAGTQTTTASTAPAKVLKKYAGTTIDAAGVQDLSDYDLSDVTSITNGGWLTLNGTLRPDVAITNTGVMAVHGGGATRFDAATITNSGWLNVD